MARKPGAISAKNLSRSLTSSNLMRLKASSSPFTITGLGGPISTTSVFSVICSSLPFAMAGHDVSYQHGDRLLDVSLERGEELATEGAVDHAVIAGERHRHDADEGDAAVRALDRLAARGSDREDGRLRRIDDRGELSHSVHAEIGEGG